MQQFLKVWSQLGLRRQGIVLAATAAMFLAILAMSRMVSAPSMTLLYAGLESGAAGDVVRALEQRGTAYEVRGGAIFVDSAQRDELRLTLASEGLPANGNRGYELLDSLTGFGTTSQMFDAAYWRAKEGELARTLVASPRIALARVHIASTGGNPFQRGTQPKASVSLTPRGGPIDASQARAVRYLVASAVAGLAPEDVAVIDANGSLIGPGEEAPTALGGEDRAKILRDRVARLLEARVGFGNAVVEVSVDTVTESEEIRERIFDPEGRVAISTDTEETTRASEGGAGGEVTVASNLPDREGAEGGGGSSQDSETRERVNYEVSETERAVIRAPGAVRRITVAVLVNDLVSRDAEGTVILTPRPEEELAALRDLVSSAVGFDAERGDIITIKSMALQSPPPTGTGAESPLLGAMDIDLMSALQMAILALVTLILGLFVVRPLLARPPAVASPPALPAATAAGEGAGAPEGTPSEADAGDPSLGLPALGAPGLPPEELGDLPAFPDLGTAAEDPVARLRGLIEERQQETVEILRGWLEQGDREEA